MNTDNDIHVTLCIDCAHLTANGETPCEYDGTETAAYLAVIEHNTRGYWTVVDPDDETNFSDTQCDMCGTGLAGFRLGGTLTPAPYDGADADRVATDARRRARWNGNDRVATFPAGYEPNPAADPATTR